MLVRILKYLPIFNIFFSSILLAQTSRDEVIQITSPNDGEILLESQVIVVFEVATFFDVGNQQCVSCDGHLKVSLNQDSIGVITSANQTTYTLSGLSAGSYFLEIEAVQPYGQSFDPVVNDTVSFTYGNVEGCPPEVLTVFGGDEENVLSWTEPTGGSGCGDNVVTGLPFSDTGTNLGMGDNWDVAGGDGEDVAYTFNVSQTVTINVDMCSELTDYDCKLEIFTNDDDCLNPVSTGNYDDDGPFGSCPDSPAPYTPSLLENVTLSPGRYYIVVDGYNGATGNYEINITTSGRNDNYSIIENTIKTEWPLEQIKMAQQGLSEEEIASLTEEVIGSYRNSSQSSTRDIPAECGAFITYRIYDSQTNTVIHETTDLNWSHGPLVNGTERCYYVTALYQEGETVISSNVACGIPQSFTAPPPTNISATPLDEEVLVYWTDPAITQLGIPYLETFNEDSGLIDLWLIDGDNWVVSSFYGNPLPSMQFSWAPTVENYEQSLFSPVIPLAGQTSVEVSFDIFFSDYTAGAQDEEYMSVEYFTGTEWVEIETWRADTSLDWTTYTDTINDLGSALQVRFRAHGVNSFDINYWLVDNFRVNGLTRSEYDFSGYNVYFGTTENDLQLFNTDTVLFETDTYVTGLTNGVEYTFGVASVHEGEPYYYSDTITATATPIWLYGDVTGIVSDPAGAVLDSAIVTISGIIDTTDSYGVYSIFNIEPGTQTCTVSRPGFYVEDMDVDVYAQQDAVSMDITMSPKLLAPLCFNSEPGDNSIKLNWQNPRSEPCGDWVYYHDNGFENGFASTDGGAGLATLFVPASYPSTIMAVRFHVSDFGTPTDDVELNIYATSVDAEPILVSGPFTISGVSNDWIEVDIDDATITSGGFLVATYNVNPGGPYISVDEDNYNGSLYFGNTTDGWQELGYFGYFNVGSHEAFMTGSGALQVTMRNDNNDYPLPNIGSNETISLEDMDIADYHGATAPRNPSMVSNTSREDTLSGYNIYQSIDSGPDIFIATTVDTFATVIVDSNYQEYCHYVKAIWDTDSYGSLESPASNSACVTPFKLGDADFDSDVDITDVLAVVDFILEESTPNDAHFRNIDLNRDEVINIADVVMVVDIIFGGNARKLEFDANEVAFIDLITDHKNSRINLDIDYNELVRGVQFELAYNPEMVLLKNPSLMYIQENVMLTFNSKEQGIMQILAVDLKGGDIDRYDNTIINIPIEFKGHSQDISRVTLDEFTLVGENGYLIDYVVRSIYSEIKMIPQNFALHQNYPNPFNPKTEIRFDLPEEGYVELTIFNIMGQNIRSLKADYMKPGYHTLVWNGTNDIGSKVSTGIYYYSLSSSNFHSTKKMLYLK
ncbi:MAG: hypothetical protein CMG74_03230 [Candidatus Marinimicrobia bacterium]|nr:hypothetical protein [Candidatus Neomarinimicrobiota bacterium]|tara:strand:+ start:2527 stop:6558 length:4032 start_codon:yes stop_codon:yes gene_type:complete